MSGAPNCLCLRSDPSCTVAGKTPGGHASAIYGKVLLLQLPIAIEAAGERQCTTSHGLRQAISGIAGDGKTPRSDQKTIIIVGIANRATGIGETCEVEVVILGVDEGLIKGSAQGLFCNEGTVVSIDDPFRCLHNRFHLCAAEIREIDIPLRGLDLEQPSLVIDIVDLVS